MLRLDTGDPKILWVSPASNVRGDGTRGNPFAGLARALSAAKPGSTIVLMDGVYAGSATVEISGSLHEPLRITAEHALKAIVEHGCWFFYDISDCIVSGVAFRNAARGAISMIGACSRNRIEDSIFMHCGSDDETSSTIFFGGSGGSCNVVENCFFEGRFQEAPKRRFPDAVSIGLMVAEGDRENGEPITDHVFRRNRFKNYDYGILVGTEDNGPGRYGHVVEYNSVVNCHGHGIFVKCGDTLVRGNVVQDCRNDAITIAGSESVVEANRIVDCGRGITVSGSGHSVVNNCMVRCSELAIRACGVSLHPVKEAASNLFVEKNTVVGCGSGPAEKTAGIVVDATATCILQRNLFADTAVPLLIEGDAGRSVVRDNRTSGSSKEVAGVTVAETIFKNPGRDDYTSGSEYGAHGWMLTPEAFDPEIDAVESENDYREIDMEDKGEEVEEVSSIDFRAFMGKFFLKNSGESKSPPPAPP